MNRTEYIQQRAAIDEAARKIALDLIREQFPDVEWTPSGQCKLYVDLSVEIAYLWNESSKIGRREM